MTPVFQVVFFALYLYYLSDYRNFRKNSKLQKGWFIGLNLVTLVLAVAVMLNFRPPMPTTVFTNIVSPWVHERVKGVSNVEADR